jgi:chromosome segregation ATPase
LAQEQTGLQSIVAVMAYVNLFEAPPPDPKHDMLWVGIGILIGYFVISFIIKALDKLRGDRMARLGDMVNELEDQRNKLAARDRRIASLEEDVQQRNRTIQFRDNTIASERQQRAEAEDENDRLRPFEMEANELRPQVGTLRDEIRDKNREITNLKADIAKTRDDLQVAYQRFETVNQRAAEGKDVERNLRTFLREREAALDRIRAQHQEELDTLRENHDNEIEKLQHERELEIEAVRANANSELDAIIITKNRELVPTTFSKFSSLKSRDVFLPISQKTRGNHRWESADFCIV